MLGVADVTVADLALAACTRGRARTETAGRLAALARNLHCSLVGYVLEFWLTETRISVLVIAGLFVVLEQQIQLSAESDRLVDSGHSAQLGLLDDLFAGSDLIAARL